MSKYLKYLTTTILITIVGMLSLIGFNQIKSKAYNNTAKDFVYAGGTNIRSVAKKIDFTKFSEITNYDNATVIDKIKIPSTLVQTEENRTHRRAYLTLNNDFDYKFGNDNKMIFSKAICYATKYYDVEFELNSLSCNLKDGGFVLPNNLNGSHLRVGTINNKQLDHQSLLNFNIKILNHDTGEIANLPRMYLALWDPDNSGAYKFYSGLRNDTMYYDENENALDNVNINGNLIYTENIDIRNDLISYVYLPIENNLNIGICGYSADEIEMAFYMKNHTVNVTSDSNGEIVNNDVQYIADGDVAREPDIKVNENYEFRYFVCKQTVMDVNGNTYKPGDKIKDITKIIVKEDLDFVAINDYKPKVVYQIINADEISIIKEQRHHYGERLILKESEIPSELIYEDSSESKNWICDKDIKIDEDEKKTGEKLSVEEINKIRIKEDLVISARVRTKPELMISNSLDRNIYYTPTKAKYTIEVENMSNDSYATNLKLSNIGTPGIKYSNIKINGKEDSISNFREDNSFELNLSRLDSNEKIEIEADVILEDKKAKLDNFNNMVSLAYGESTENLESNCNADLTRINKITSVDNPTPKPLKTGDNIWIYVLSALLVICIITILLNGIKLIKDTKKLSN